MKTLKGKGIASDFLSFVEQTISDCYKVKTSKAFKEDKSAGRQRVEYKSQGKQLVYSFDVNTAGIAQVFPFFKDAKGLKSVSDYIVFTNRKSDSQPFILIFELKKSEFPKQQLIASSEFCQFIIQRINTVFKQEFKPIIRMIGLVEKMKTATRIDKQEYNNGILYTPLRTLDISKLLK